jgi:hypothetical protein
VGPALLVSDAPGGAAGHGRSRATHGRSDSVVRGRGRRALRATGPWVFSFLVALAFLVVTA